jgi:hypothetical protein
MGRPQARRTFGPFNSSREAKDATMKLWQDLLTTDYGLLSLAVLVFILVMAWWYLRFFMRKMALPPGKE